MKTFFCYSKKVIDDVPQPILDARKMEREEARERFAIEAIFSLIILAVAIGTCHFCK